MLCAGTVVQDVRACSISRAMLTTSPAAALNAGLRRRTQALHQEADGSFKPCEATPGVEAQTQDIASISSAFSSVVKDVAVAFQLPLQSMFSDQAIVDESKKLGEGIPSAASSAETQIPAPLPLPAASSAETQIPAPLPLPAKFALPPSHWIPHPLVFRPSTLPPAQGALEAQVSNPTELEEPIQTAVLEDFQLRTTTIEESDPRTWLPPPPPQKSNSAEDEEPISKCAKRREVSRDHTAALEGPPLKTARIGEPD